MVDGGSAEDKRTVVRWLRSTFLGGAVTGILLFLPAGSLRWWLGWFYLISLVIVGTVTVFVVEPGLLAERLQRRPPNQKAWDKILFGLYGLMQGLVVPVIAAFEFRFNWQPEVPVWLLFFAAAIYILGWWVNLWAMQANPFFAKVVRLQADRGQVVATGGPYRYIRHPGYLGGILILATTPLILGSFWACLPGAAGAVMLVVRTVLEDRMLQEELEGYQAYAQHTPYKLVPRVW